MIARYRHWDKKIQEGAWERWVCGGTIVGKVTIASMKGWHWKNNRNAKRWCWKLWHAQGRIWHKMWNIWQFFLLKSNTLACQFHWFGEMTQESWVRDKGQLITYSNCSYHSFNIFIHQFPGAWCPLREKGQLAPAQAEGFIVNRELWALETPIFYNWL